MSVYRIKGKQSGRKCDWCGILAVWRGLGWGKCACSDHHAKLAEWDRRESQPDYSDAAFYGGFA